MFWRVVVGVDPLDGGMEVYTLFIGDAWRAKYYGMYLTRMEWARAVIAAVKGIPSTVRLHLGPGFEES